MISRCFPETGCTMSNCEYILEMSDISKRFPGVLALDGVSLRVRKGTVHALMGENGAGKSTLMKILIGLYPSDTGRIVFKGEELAIKRPADALSHGISMIHQELSPVLDMTVSENIFLGKENTKAGFWVDVKKNNAVTQSLFDELNLTGISPKEKLRNLSVAQMQMLEIAKAISYNADLIIMDEPTSSITESEVKLLFDNIRKLKEKGTSFIYISHKMDEIFQIADDITVFRDGQLVGSDSSENLDNAQLIKMMVGRELKDLYDKTSVDISDPVLEVQNLTNPCHFHDISFSLRRGEILGITGLVGAGRTEIVETIFGLQGPYTGSIIVNGETAKIKSPRDAIKHGMALATEDRKQQGLALELPIRENITITALDDVCQFGLVNMRKENALCKKQIESLRIKTSDPNNKVSSLSGGNQQKVVLAKWLNDGTEILILDEPTKGIDIGAKNEIYRLMEEFVKQGKAIIMISSEMPEVLGMSDRILVIADGRLKGVLNRDEASQIKIMTMISE